MIALDEHGRPIEYAILSPYGIVRVLRINDELETYCVDRLAAKFHGLPAVEGYTIPLTKEAEASDDE